MDERKMAVLCAGLALAVALFVLGYGRPQAPVEARTPTAQGRDIRVTPPGRPAAPYSAPRGIRV